ncbi:MAG: hypothetical protein ACNJA3_28060 (plasmid) [Pseudomonas rhizophila]|uniref:hypothetical protein n=1 Tax=Pseudomonas rhizophila TaxID=2045200 RepID=UPI003F6D64A5
MFDLKTSQAQSLKAKYRAELKVLKIVTGLLMAVIAAGFVFLLVQVYRHPTFFSFTLVGVSVVLATAAYRYMYYLPAKRDRQRYSNPSSANRT